MTKERIAEIFNIWAERYAANPEDFGPVLDSEGNVVEDYGITCAEYFIKIQEELDG